MKRIIALVLAVVLCMSFAACTANSPTETQKTETQTGSETKDPAATGTDDRLVFEGKIGLMVGTVSSSEEEYRAAERWLKVLGEDHCTIQTYPDNFMKEEETTISNLISLVSDPEIKAVIFLQGVAGSSAAISKAKEVRPDVLYINAGPTEDPDVVCRAADLVVGGNDYETGPQIAERAHEMGADTIVYYSCPRHQGYEKVAYKGNGIETRAKELGMTFVRVDVPDPMSDAGVAGEQQFIIEDVPKQIQAHGEKTAFFDSILTATPAVVKALYDTGKGIYMETSQGTPFLGYPEALGISVPSENIGDYEWMIEEIRNKLKETNDNGRFSTREIPMVVLMMDTSVYYAIDFINGKTNGEKVDMDHLRACLAETTGLPLDSPEIGFNVYDYLGKSFDNYALFYSPYAML